MVKNQCVYDKVTQAFEGHFEEFFQLADDQIAICCKYC